MLREGPVPRVVHGAFEYLAGLLFLAAPILLDYESGTATGVSVTVGVVILIVAAVTADLPTSLVKQLTLSAHVAVDFVLAIFLVAAPFVLGFSDEAAPRNLFMAMGVLHLLITIGTRFKDRSEHATP
ncbi:MAG: SPW repeat domain-containing protein [Jiangellaceae bacterium]